MSSLIDKLFDLVERVRTFDHDTKRRLLYALTIIISLLLLLVWSAMTFRRLPISMPDTADSTQPAGIAGSLSDSVESGAGQSSPTFSLDTLRHRLRNIFK